MLQAKIVIQLCCFIHRYVFSRKENIFKGVDRFRSCIVRTSCPQIVRPARCYVQYCPLLVWSSTDSEENPRWISSEPYYDSLYCNVCFLYFIPSLFLDKYWPYARQWDTYRTLYPLMSLHDPETYARIVRSFIDIQQHEGWLPECRGATLQQFIQGGSSGDPILAELFIKWVLLIYKEGRRTT